MSQLELHRLDDAHLEARLVDLAARDRATTSELLAHLAEADARQLHRSRGHESLHAYCVEHLRFSESAAHKRIGVARVVREHPSVLARIADGSLSLSTVLVLRPWLNGSHAEELLATCAGRSRSAIEVLLAERFPQSESFEWGTQLSDSHSSASHAAERSLAPGRADASIPQKVVLNNLQSTSTPLTGARVVLQVTVARSTQEKLQRARELLGFAVASDDVADVLDRALDALIVSLEKRRHGLHVATPPDRAARADRTLRGRHIPAPLRRSVFMRDGGRCTFVGPTGHRCTSRHALEYDHVKPLALGGVTSLANLRLLCWAHNQYEAERRLGADFMRARRVRPRAPEAIRKDAHHERACIAHEPDLTAALRNLGYRGAEIRVGLGAAAQAPHDADLAGRLRLALRALGRGTLAAAHRVAARGEGAA